MTSLVDKLVSDDLWALVEAPLPTNAPPYGGRHRTIGDRNCSAAARDAGRGEPQVCRQPSVAAVEA